MICNIPKIETWTSYLNDRFHEAKEIGLVGIKSELNHSSAIVVLPDSMTSMQVDPNLSFREPQGSRTSTEWIKRVDCFEEAAKWIIDNYSSLKRAELICEAGYSRIGDKTLESRKHIIICDKPFFNLQISITSPDIIAKTLRWGRSWRLLGIIGNVSINHDINEHNCSCCLFFCDVCDGDSIIFTKIKRGNV